MVKKSDPHRCMTLKTPAPTTPESQATTAPVTDIKIGRRPKSFLRHLQKVATGKLSKPAVRRLCRRAGVKRIGDIYEETLVSLRQYLKMILKDIVVLTDYAQRMTVSLNDVLIALKRRGRTLYGFGDGFSEYGGIEKQRSIRKLRQAQHAIQCNAESTPAVDHAAAMTPRRFELIKGGVADFFTASPTRGVKSLVLLKRLKEQLLGCAASELSDVLTVLEEKEIIFVDGAYTYLI